MFKALGLGTFVRGDDDDDEDLDGSEGSELFEEAAGDVAPAKDKEEASAAAPAPARIPPRNESGTGNGTPRHAARRGPNSPVIASGRVSRLTTVTSRLSPYSRPPKTPRTTAVTPGGEKSATGGFLSILRGFASPALSLIRRSPQRDDSEEDESDEDELSGSFKSNGAAGGVKEKPMQRVEAAFESEDDEPILKRKPSASVANTPLISTKGPASPPPFISTRAFADIPSSSTPGVSREEATKATSQLISSPTGFSFKPPTSPSKKSTAPANDFRPSPVSPPKRTDSVFSFKTVGAAPTVDIQQSDAEKPLAVAFSDKPASAFAEKPAGAFSFVNPPRTESGMDVDRPSTAPRDTRLGAYSEIANLLARKGDEPLDVEEAARVQQLLKKTIVAPPSFGFHSAGASSSQALVRTASVKGAKAPLWQSIFKPGASTLGPSSVVTAVHDATVTIRPPRRRQEPHYGASFGFTSNPYKRSLGAGRPHPQWTAPRLGEPSSKRQKVVDKQDSMDGGDIAAGVISAALDDVKPPTKLLTPLGEGFTGTNPYERDISNRVGYEMPTFSAKPKVAAIVREVKSKTVGPVGSSAILRARIKGKSVAFATGTPVKRSEGAEFAKTPGITRPQTASKKRATERAVGTAKGTASTSAAFGVATSVIVEDLGTPAVLPKDVSMGEASPAFGMAPKAQEAFGGVTLKEAGPPATPSVFSRLGAFGQAPAPVSSFAMPPVSAAPAPNFSRNVPAPSASSTVGANVVGEANKGGQASKGAGNAVEPKPAGVSPLEKAKAESASTLPKFSFADSALASESTLFIRIKSAGMLEKTATDLPTFQWHSHVSPGFVLKKSYESPITVKPVGDSPKMAFSPQKPFTFNPGAAGEIPPLKWGNGATSVNPTGLSTVPNGGTTASNFTAATPLNLFKPSSLTKPEPTAVSEAPTGGFNWSAAGAAKPAAAGWTCGVCMVKNEDSKAKCASCESEKPKPAAATPAPTASKFNWGAAVGTPSAAEVGGTWICSICMVKNENSSSKCVACEAPKP